MRSRRFCLCLNGRVGHLACWAHRPFCRSHLGRPVSQAIRGSERRGRSRDPQSRTDLKAGAGEVILAAPRGGSEQAPLLVGGGGALSYRTDSGAHTWTRSYPRKHVPQGCQPTPTSGWAPAGRPMCLKLLFHSRAAGPYLL